MSSIVLAAGHASSRAVYTGTCMLGLFLSSTAPTIISMAEQYVDLTGWCLLQTFLFHHLYFPLKLPETI